MLHAGVKIVCHLLVTALDMHHLACKKEVGCKRRRGEGGRNIHTHAVYSKRSMH